MLGRETTLVLVFQPPRAHATGGFNMTLPYFPVPLSAAVNQGYKMQEPEGDFKEKDNFCSTHLLGKKLKNCLRTKIW